MSRLFIPSRPFLFLIVAACLLCVVRHSRAQFVEVPARETGIDFVHTNGSSGQYFVVEPYSAGLALFDYDGDGLEDVYFVNGAALPTNPSSGLTHHEQPTALRRGLSTNRLYRNLGNWHFQDVTVSAGVADPGYGLGVVGGDFDNDGDTDLYISNFGPNVLYINQGDGTFNSSKQDPDLILGDRFSAGAVFLDFDNDGILDLFCGHYQQYKFENHVRRMIGQHRFHPGPNDYPAEYDQLFRGKGEGHFEDVSVDSRIAAKAFTSMGAIAADFDQDGDVDLVVGNDSQPNSYYVNEGNGRFRNEALSSGLAFDGTGASTGNMGVETRDIDGDGDLDIFTTTYQDQMPVLYENLGDGFFDDSTNRIAIDRSLHPHVNWGLALEDFNLDGLCDVYVANGHFMDNLAAISDKTHLRVRDYIQFQQPDGRLSIAEPEHIGASRVESARGAAFGDLDLDGDIDSIVLNANAAPSVLRNELIPNNTVQRDRHDLDEETSAELTELDHGPRWLRIRLVGTISNRDAAGALVTFQPDSMNSPLQTASVHLGRGYQSHYGQSLHFGVGSTDESSSASYLLKIRWPSGIESKHKIDRLNQSMTIIEPSF